MQPLSVVIITYNEQENIGRCIRSVKCLADEIIVLDSGSTDKTVAIAGSLGAIVYHQNFKGYIEQKNRALQLASYDYILSLDADEALDATLTASILEAKRKLKYKAWSMNRSTSFCGRFLHHGLWYPDRKIRLFDRRFAQWGGLNPHDKIILREGVAVRHLKGDILHYAFNNPEDHINRNNRISSIAAQSYYESGRRSSWYKMTIHPAWAFFNGYVLRRGFLEGIEGFSFAVNTAYQVFLKYYKLYRLQKTAGTEKKFSTMKLLLPEKDTIANDI